MSEVRVCFLGTPNFAAHCLEALLKDEHYKVVGVVTQPDRPKGRKLQLMPSEVKELALRNQLPVLTPESLRKQPEVVEEIKKWKAEVAIVVAFGQILDQTFLDLFPLGCVNVHASLLPRWRGAAPIQRSVEAGDRKTGVCLQKMVLKLDAGDLIGQREIELDNQMDSLELHDRLKVLSTELLHIELMDYLRGNLVPVPQQESEVTYAKKIEKSESELDFNLPAPILHKRIRAFGWGPGTFTWVAEQRLKIHKTRFVSSVNSSSANAREPGKILKITDKSFIVETGEGELEILTAQPENKNKMTGLEVLQRLNLKLGDRLGK
ncbi:MAG: methionyl-tRNA formyltransferase [Bdellovibrionales bacterium]